MPTVIRFKAKVSTALILGAILFILNPAFSMVSLGIPFSDHMVLQRNIPVPIWGEANPHESISVSFRGQQKSTQADLNGKWKVFLDASSEGGPYELIVQGTNDLVLSDIMVGEVWFCSGQSNMQFSISNLGGPNLDSIKAAELPNLRFMDFKGSKKWNSCSPSLALNLSATSYYFGRELQRNLNIPIGLIISAEGGTPLERWMDPVSISNDSILKRDTSSQKGDLFKSLIQPLAPFAIKGFIWYQGESNAEFYLPSHPNWTVGYYRERFKALIKGWRAVWDQGDIPFCFAQIANFRTKQTDPGETSSWAELREAQRLSLTLPNTSMAVLIDIGDSVNIHPLNKWEVGKRMALPVLNKSYGVTQLEWSGPNFESAASQGNTVRMKFSHAQGLIAKDLITGLKTDKLMGFAIAGMDKKWVWADATIKEDSVIIKAESIDIPTMVRYGWAYNPDCNLFNSSGLPASPFQVKISQSRLESYSYSMTRFSAKDRKQPSLKLRGVHRNALGRNMKTPSPRTFSKARILTSVF